MFRVTVVGDYVARSAVSDREKVKKRYEIEGNIPSLKAPLSTVKNKLLGPALAAKYPDYVTFLTYHIVKTVPLDEKSQVALNKVEVDLMNRPALLNYIQTNALPVDPEYYPDLFKLREAVQYAKDDPKGYERHFELRKEDLLMDLQMAEANPDLFRKDEHGFVASVTLDEPPAPAPAPKAKKPAPSGASSPVPEPAKKKKASKKASSAKNLQKKTDDRLKGLTNDQIKDGDMGPLDETPDPDVGDL